jgi:hypothetical protein
MRESYARRGVELNAARLRMATLPTPSEVLFTPGQWVPLVNIGGVYILPGIPRLFQAMVSAHQARAAAGQGRSNQRAASAAEPPHLEPPAGAGSGGGSGPNKAAALAAAAHRPHNPTTPQPLTPPAPHTPSAPHPQRPTPPQPPRPHAPCRSASAARRPAARRSTPTSARATWRTSSPP